ncbi:hydroxycarboxylic acid receptor 1-2 [Danio rerio]|uniref:G-protein coupled receptor 81 n=1 Tax=Danio rerio TaxID=7955 RepID=C6EVZ8_DANRE|nr:hydroxycarboxylic acid receptor 1-2 [Danio rerio]ACJ03854.1 G-protein coupled receptor 81 [Danio rerio]|eukprot:NP_001156767.1 hydroxycarboxylic acid receptor 1-2 [Danio rerio]
MNNSSLCCTYETPLLDAYLPPVLFSEFVLGLMGNGLALCMFFFHRDSWKPNSIYLAHLALADSLVLFCLPFRADYYRRGKHWVYGDAFCRVLLFLLAANRAAGIFFLTAVAVDRYLKIVHPLNRINQMGLRYALWVSVGLWALIIAMTVYLLADKHFYYLNNHTQCESFNICFGSNSRFTWHNVFYVIQFFVPTFIVIYCSTCITWQLKGKTIDKHGKIRRAVRFVLAVALVFIICFFPSNISRISMYVLKLWYNECQYFSDANDAFKTTVCFTYFNSVLNPVVYYFSSPAVSGSLRKIYMRMLGQKIEE